MAEYLFQGKLDNTVHDITPDQIRQLYLDNKREERECLKMTHSSYQGECFVGRGEAFDQMGLYRDYLERDPRTAGLQIYYPHGVIIEQAMRKNYYRGENQIYLSSVPTLVRTLRAYKSRKEKELYRMVADMRIYEFSSLLRRFQHVKNWHIGDVLYETLAQHYGLETSWLDITSDFNVALFFACCYYENGRWYPLTKDHTEVDDAHRYGMIFHMPSWQMAERWSFHGRDFLTSSDKVVEYKENGEPLRYEKLEHPIYRGNPGNLIYPIGFQPFMRCHMQNGYGIYMRNEQPLQQDIGFEKLRFRHSEKLSRWIYEKMQGGELIYPHEGLRQAEDVIEQIRNLKEFSEEAFLYALQRNHLFTLADMNKVQEELEQFCVDGETIRIVQRHPWKLSALRRKRIDEAYQNFSVEQWYGIHIITRQCIPGPSPMFEPWMIMEEQDEPGVVDFKVRREVRCGHDIYTRDYMRMLMMLMTAKMQDF